MSRPRKNVRMTLHGFAWSGPRGAIRPVPKVIYDPPPGGIDLPTVPFTPAAHTAFTPAELEQRLELYRTRLAAGVPLTGTGAGREDEPDDQRARAICFACGDQENGFLSSVRGWKSRRDAGSGVVEIYCPTCFHRWGWPDVER